MSRVVTGVIHVVEVDKCEQRGMGGNVLGRPPGGIVFALSIFLDGAYVVFQQSSKIVPVVETGNGCLVFLFPNSAKDGREQLPLRPATE